MIFETTINLKNKNKEELLDLLNDSLNLIQSQQKEIEKNKEFINYLQLKDIKNLDIIIYMANFINDNTPYTKDMKILEDEKGLRTVNFTVQYFEKKVEGK